MTTAVLGVSVDAGAPALSVRAAVAPISAAGVNDTAAMARQQLVNAVPAPAAIAAYSASIVPQPKPVVRAAVAIPSSALAAQFIAQDAASTAAELDIFVPRSTATPPADAPMEDDYLSALRIARGDIPPAKSAPLAATSASGLSRTEEGEQAQFASATLTANAARETVVRNVVAQAAAGLPALFTQFIRRPTIVTARGLSAYQLAEARNAGMRQPVAAG
jgi:hypothetical protein